MTEPEFLFLSYAVVVALAGIGMNIIVLMDYINDKKRKS